MRYRYKWQQDRSVGADVVLTKWCGSVLARSHALLPKIRVVADHQSRNELTTISIRGREGTGKTTLAKVIAHALHTEMDSRAKAKAADMPAYEARHLKAIQRGYIVRILKAEDLDTFTALIKSMPEQNRILVFDDASFMGHSSSNYIRDIKKQITRVRHVSGQDYKVVLIYNFHYSRALDPYLRDTNFIAQTSISTQEARNMADMYGEEPGNMPLLDAFKKFSSRMQSKGQVTVDLGKRTGGRRVTYKYSSPFRLGTWFDGSTLSLIVYPAAGGPRGEPDPLGVQDCGICMGSHAHAAPDDAMPSKNSVPAADVLRWLKNQWERSDQVGAILRDVYLRRYGHDPVRRSENAGIEMLRRLEANGIVDFESLVLEYHGSDSAVGRRLLDAGASYKPRVPGPKRDAFLEVFGVDGLRPPGTEPRPKPKEDEDAVKRLV